MELTNEVYDAINRYFSVLSHTGYKSDEDVNKLLVFTFLEELIYGPLSQFVTDKDYKAINDSIYCMYGSCMIPFPSYKKSFNPSVNRMFDKYRLTETGLFRYAQLFNLRIES